MPNKIPKGTDPTDHHNYATSIGGSGDTINISKIKRRRHEKFHNWACNLPPCVIIPRLLLHGIMTKNQPSPATVENIFRVTGTRNPTHLYASEAIRSMAEPQALKAAQSFEAQVFQELVITRETLQVITNGGTFPVHVSKFLSRAQEYFLADTATECAISLCTERDEDNELAWVKPMKKEIHERIMETLSDNHRLRTKRSKKREFSRILQTHIACLEKSHDQWKKVLEDFNNNEK